MKTISRQRRTWRLREKATIVLEILREESPLAEISKKYDIAQPVLNRWKAEFISNMPAVFDKKGEDIQKVKPEKETLIKKIGELSMDVDYLKKNRNRFYNFGKKGTNRVHRLEAYYSASMRVARITEINRLSYTGSNSSH